MTVDLTQFALSLLLVTVLVVSMGMWLVRTFTDPSHNVVERLTYRILGVDPRERMSWKRYGMALVLSNAAMMGSASSPCGCRDSSRATRWRGIARPRTSPSTRRPRSSPTPTGSPIRARAVFRLLADAGHHLPDDGERRDRGRRGRRFHPRAEPAERGDIGNFWVDFVRSNYRVPLPLSFLVALLYRWQG